MELDSYVQIVQAIMVILGICIPSFGIYLKKVSNVAKQAANRADEEKQLSLVVAEALADGDVDNEEIKRIVLHGQKIGVQSKELYLQIVALVEKSKVEAKK